MVEATIDSLKLEISSSSDGASKGLDALTRSLKKLQTATSKGLGLGAVVTEIKQGKVSVSRKDLLPKPEGFEEVKREKRDRKDKK